MRLKLNRTLRAALIAAITAVGTTLPQTQATEKYTAPAFGGAEYVWTNGHWEYPAGTTVDNIARVNSKGGVMIIENAGTVSNPVGVEDTSDYGGVHVKGDTNFTTALGSWAGSIFVEAAAVLNASYGISLKNTEAATAANVYVDGTLNITGRNNLNLNDGNNYQNWYIGETGFINLSSITGVTKGSRSWNIQLGVDAGEPMSLDGYTNRSLGGQLTKNFMSTGADLYGQVASFAVFCDGVEMDSSKYTINHDASGMSVTYDAETTIKNLDLTWAGGEGTWEVKGTHWRDAQSVETSFANGDNVTFTGSGNVAKVSGAVEANAIIVSGGTTTIDTSADGASVAAGTLNLATVSGTQLSITGGGAVSASNINATGSAIDIVNGATLAATTLTLDNGTTTLSGAGNMTLGGFAGSGALNIGTNLAMGAVALPGSASNIHVQSGGVLTVQTTGTTVGGKKLVSDNGTGEADGTGFTNLFKGGAVDVQGTGKLVLKGNVSVTDSTVTGKPTHTSGVSNLEIQGNFKINTWGEGSTWALGSHSMKVTGEAWFTNKQYLTVDGGNFEAGKLVLGHDANEGNYPGGLTATNSTVTLGGIGLYGPKNAVSITGGTLTFNATDAVANVLSNLGDKAHNNNSVTLDGVTLSSGSKGWTLAPVDGATVTATGTTTLNVDEEKPITLNLSAGSTGSFVKQGAGTATINGTSKLASTIQVQQGTLVLNGEYSIDGITDGDVHESYIGTDGQAHEEGGFYLQSGTKTVYAVAATGANLDLAHAVFTYGGSDVTSQVDGGSFIIPGGEPEYSILYVNKDTVDYAAHAAYAQDKGVSITSVVIKDGATVNLGENSTIANLQYAATGISAGIAGQGSIAAITGTGTLNLLDGAVVTVPDQTLGANQAFATSGEGTLKMTNLHVSGNGAVATIGSKAILERISMGAGTVNLNGDITTGRLMLSYDNAASTVNIGTGATVHVTGTVLGDHTSNASFMLSNWAPQNTLNIQGHLIAEAGFSSRDGSAVVNVESGGTLEMRAGLDRNTSRNHNIDVTVKDGGKLLTAGNSADRSSYGLHVNLQGGSTLEGYYGQDVSAITINQTLTLGGGTVTINPGATGKQMTINNMTGAGASITKAGEGTLVLGSNASYTGATTVEAGILKATHVGSGDITVGAGATLDLTGASAITTTGNLTLGNCSTLVLAGENMLSVGALALAEGTTALTLNLDNIVPATAHTVVLATGATVAPLNDVTVNVEWTTLPEYLEHGVVQVQDNSWVITLTSLGQELIWDGGEAVWSSEVQHWHAEGTPEAHTGFSSGDKAIFAASGTPAVASLTGAVSAQSMTVAAGADVTVQAAAESTGAALTPVILEIAGTLATSVNTIATNVEASGTNAAWNITGGSVTAETITAAEGAALALAISNEASLAAGTLAADGTISVSGTANAGNVTGAGIVSVVGTLNAGKVTIETGKTLSLGGTGAIGIGTSATKGDATLNGAGTLALTGGTVTIHGTNKDSFTGNVDVQAGTLKLGESTGDKFVLGAYNYNTDRTITVHTGATLDLNGQADGNYVYTLAGGRLTNTGNAVGINSSQTVGLKLTANSYVGGDGSNEFWLRQRTNKGNTTIELGEYSLTKQGGNTFGLYDTAVTGSGSLVVEGGTVNFNGGSIASNVVLNGGSIAGTLTLAGDITITAKQNYTMGATVNVGSHTLTLATDEGKAISYSAKYEHGTAGTINAAGTVNYTQGLTVNAGTVNVAGIVSVDAHSLDLSNGSTSTGKVSVTSTGVLNVNSGMWMNTNAIDIAEGGIVNIAGLQIIGQTGGATIATTVPNQQYGTTNDKYTITNATVNVNGNITLGNALDGADVVVADGSSLTLNSNADSVTVNGGGTFTLGEGKTVTTITVNDGGTIAGGVDAKDVGIVAQGTATFDEGIHEAGIDIEGWVSGATVKNTGATTAKYTGLQDSNMKVAADTLYALNEEAVVVDNALEVGIIMHDGTAALTLTQVDAEVLSGVYANDGVLALQNITAVGLTEMSIASGTTVAVYQGTEEVAAQEGTVTITDTLTAGGGTLLANLEMADGSTLDISLVGGGVQALTLGSEFTIDDGALVKLDEATLAAIAGLVNIGDKVILIQQYDDHALTTNLEDGDWSRTHFDLSSITDADYKLFVQDGQIGLVKSSMVPEPTTGTLSLLALMALAARRRRK